MSLSGNDRPLGSSGVPPSIEGKGRHWNPVIKRVQDRKKDRGEGETVLTNVRADESLAQRELKKVRLEVTG